MSTWALLNDGEEIAAFRGIDVLCVENCETVAVNMGLAAELQKGVALAPGVEIVCLEDDDDS